MINPAGVGEGSKIVFGTTVKLADENTCQNHLSAGESYLEADPSIHEDDEIEVKASVGKRVYEILEVRYA